MRKDRVDSTKILDESCFPFREVYKKVFFKECALAGATFHIEKDDELWDMLDVGTELALIRQSDNKYDPNAVAVALADDFDGDTESFDFDFILGYIPRESNSELAALMDAGYADKFSAVISSYDRQLNYNNRIRLTIFVESAVREIIRPDLLRAESLSRSEFARMVNELHTRGTAYFRFGGYISHPYAFPEVGEKIVMLHRDASGEVLYLMRVLASDEDCIKYLPDPGIIKYDESCVPYILSNIMGPVKIRKTDWPFLQGVDLKGFAATDYLCPTLSDGFDEIFRSQLPKILYRNNIDMDPSIDS